MFNRASRLSVAGASLLTVGLAAGVIVPFVTAAPEPTAVAQNSTSGFPDIQSHWARPFIEGLANQNIITGYPDGTYRPDEPANRDEFAAIVRQAFNQEQVRSIPRGSAFEDVPEGYWAEPAIENAYETGFMSGYENTYFRPQQNISKVDAIVALAGNLNLVNSAPAVDQAAISPEASPNPADPAPAAVVPNSEAQTTPGSRTRRTAKRPLLFPLAMTSLMQPLFSAQAAARNSVAPAPTAPQSTEAPSGQNQAATAPPAPEAGNTASQPSSTPVATTVISNYYTDADQVPQEALEEVAAATQSGLVVNYPNPSTLNPNQPATRGEIAALIHQALVHQKRLEPISEGEATGYIVNPR